MYFQMAALCRDAATPALSPEERGTASARFSFYWQTVRPIPPQIFQRSDERESPLLGEREAVAEIAGAGVKRL